MFQYEMIDLPEIAIIGKEGLCTKEKNVVPDLWQQANTNFSDVADLGMKNADGSFVGFWGAMSDETRSFMPWTDDFSRGLYLAGIEVYEDTPVPDGWIKWVLPARKYLVTEVSPESYGEIFGYVINSLIPDLGMKLAGAVCDFTEPATGQNKLFFPIEGKTEIYGTMEFTRRQERLHGSNSLEEHDMNQKALVVIDLQNDITKHYRDVIDRVNSAIEWAAESGMEVVYVRHNNLSAGTHTFKPGTKGAELVPELRIVSDHSFVKTKANALTSEAFSEFIRSKEIREFYVTGADATACVKSTCFNMAKAGYTVHVVSDCVTSYDLKKLPEMLAYYSDKGCEVRTLEEYRKHD